MLNLQIVIVDEDMAYSEKLSNYLMHYEQHHFSAKLFSDLTHLSNYLKNNSTDILITTEKLYLKMQFKHPMVILLTDNSIHNDLKQLPCINKYQKGENIAEQIILYYTKNSDKEIIGGISKDLFRVTGFYSPEGGSGKTTLSIAYAMLLALKGHKTLFFSMEEYASYSNLLTSSNETSLSDLLYYLKNKPNNLLMKLEGIIKCDEETGLLFLPPPLYAEDMALSEAGDWEYLIECLQNSKGFDRVVIDFTVTKSKKNDTVMKLCNKIVTPVDMSRGENNKATAFINCMDESLKEKLVLITNNRMPSENSSINEIGNLKINLSVPYVGRLNEPREFKQTVRSEGPFKQSMLNLTEVVEYN